jgi:FtsP/CotA-like multicopper oxidase with cupredoxin domain
VPSQHAFVKGKLASTYGYSSSVLGPVIRIRRGDEAEMTIQNALKRITTALARAFGARRR